MFEKFDELFRLNLFNSAFEELINLFNQKKIDKCDLFEKIEYDYLRNGKAEKLTNENLNKLFNIYSKENGNIHNIGDYLEQRSLNKIGKAIFPTFCYNRNGIFSIEVKEGEFKINHNILKEADHFYNTLLFLSRKINSYLKDENNKNNITILTWETEINVTAPENFLIEGKSCEFAIIAAFISYIFKVPIKDGYVLSGCFNSSGRADYVNNITEKFNLIKKEIKNLKKFFIPKFELNNDDSNLSSLIKNNQNIIIQISDIDDLVEKVFDKKLSDLCIMPYEDIKKLSGSYIEILDYGKRKVSFYSRYIENIKLFDREMYVQKWFWKNKNPYRLLTFNKIEIKTPNSLIIFDGPLSNVFTGYLMSHFYHQATKSVFGARTGSNSNVARIFSDVGNRENSELVGCSVNLDELFSDDKSS